MTHTLVAFFLACCLTACGGGGGSGPGSGPGTFTSPVTTIASHEVTVGSQAMTVKLAVDGDMVMHLVRNNATASIPLISVKTLVWNSQCKGWHVSGGSGIQVPFIDEKTGVPFWVSSGGAGLFVKFSNLTPSDRGAVSVITKDDVEYFLNTDNITVTGGIVKNGGIWYGDTTSASITCPGVVVITPPVTTTASHEVTLSAGSMAVKLALNTDNTITVINLVRNGHVAVVPLDSIRQVVWNSQCKGWRTSGGHGVAVPYRYNETTILGLALPSDRGLISVLTLDGDEYFVNTDKTAVTGGIVKEGGLWYGDTTSASITCPS